MGRGERDKRYKVANGEPGGTARATRADGTTPPAAGTDQRLLYAAARTREVRAHVQQVADVCDLAERLADELLALRVVARRALARPGLDADLIRDLKRIAGEAG